MLTKICQNTLVHRAIIIKKVYIKDLKANMGELCFKTTFKELSKNFAFIKELINFQFYFYAQELRMLLM